MHNMHKTMFFSITKKNGLYFYDAIPLQYLISISDITGVARLYATFNID